MDTITENFSEKGDKREIARMTSLGLPHAGNWLSVVPSPAPGLHLRSFLAVGKGRKEGRKKKGKKTQHPSSFCSTENSLNKQGNQIGTVIRDR